MNIFKILPVIVLAGCSSQGYVRDYCVLYQPVKLTPEEKFLLSDEANKPLVISIKKKIVVNNVTYEELCK